MTARLLASALLLLMLALPAHAQQQQQGSSSKAFRTPSGLVGCMYTTGPAYLRCDTKYRTKYSGRQQCEGDYGKAFGLTKRGAARPLCVSDTAIDAHAAKLAYGKTKHFGPFTCTSRQSGLTCRNAKGHGWSLSKEKQRLF